MMERVLVAIARDDLAVGIVKNQRNLVAFVFLNRELQIAHARAAVGAERNLGIASCNNFPRLCRDRPFGAAGAEIALIVVHRPQRDGLVEVLHEDADRRGGLFEGAQTAAEPLDLRDAQ